MSALGYLMFIRSSALSLDLVNRRLARQEIQICTTELRSKLTLAGFSPTRTVFR